MRLMWICSQCPKMIPYRRLALKATCCSDQCKAAAKRAKLPPRLCLCGAVVPQARQIRRARWCSESCQETHNARKRREALQRRHPCEGCMHWHAEQGCALEAFRVCAAIGQRFQYREVAS